MIKHRENTDLPRNFGDDVQENVSQTRFFAKSLRVRQQAGVDFAYDLIVKMMGSGKRDDVSSSRRIDL